VQIAAVGPAAGAASGDGGAWPTLARGEGIVNGTLGGALNLTGADQTVLLSLPSVEDTPRDAALARRSREESISGMRLRVQRVVDEPGVLSLFNPDGGQRVPRNAWVNLPQLQDAVGQRGRANALFVHDTAPTAGATGAEQLNDRLKQVVRLEDYGLSFAPGGGGDSVLNSRSTYIDPPVISAAEEAAKATGVPLRRASVYLVNAVEKLAAPGSGPAKIHYAVTGAVSEMAEGTLAPGEVALNQWTADRLGAKAGDKLVLRYYQRQPSGNLTEVASDAAPLAMSLTVRRILPMTGLGADPSLTPAYKGLTDADSVADWDPPQGVDIDKSLVTKEDEAYWDAHKAAPKLFVNFDDARRLWGGAYGDVTSLRVPADRADAFGKELLARLDPASMGLAFRGIKAEQVAAASGSTDFAMLFVSFSFFLIAAAALLVAMLFRLNIEQRARQLGLLSAVGFSPAGLRRLALGEGMLLALIGGLIGLAGAVGYTWLMMAGLRTWWVGAVGTTAMRLHVEPRTLAIGLVASLAVAFLAILWAVWNVGRAQAARLLAGGWNAPTPGKARAGRVAGRVAAAAGAVGLLLLALGMAGVMSQKGAFMGGGALLLVASLSFLAARLRPHRGGTGAASPASGGSTFSVQWLGVRNASRHTARSVLSVGLIAFAAFTIVTVAAMREGPPTDMHVKTSGAGGFRLILQAGIPLLADLSTPQGRELLGVQPADAPLWDRATFTSMRSWAGQDISCLNLTRPSSPTILAVPPAMVERGGFKFAKTAAKADNPWTLLDAAPTQDAAGNLEIPVVTDDETATYILHLGSATRCRSTTSSGGRAS
jgi:hypothetical protein